jgi:N-acyl-D-aspartate/D-glutamate deacylase
MRQTLAMMLLATLPACWGAPSYDLVVANGRVMDPESGTDAIRFVGIDSNKIAAVSEIPLRGKRVIDATNLVVAPGFIDLHEHGQNEESYKLMVRDGVTSALELEVGTANVAKFYDDRKAGQLVNYGVSIGHLPVRMIVFNDPSKDNVPPLPSGAGGSAVATDAQIARIDSMIRKGLGEGAVAVGLGSAYAPGATMAEIRQVFEAAADSNASAHIHMRNNVAGLDSTIAAAKAAGAKLHIVHVNSSGDTNLVAFLTHIQKARDNRQDVTTEAYPYGAGMTAIQSALFDDWRTWPDARFGQHQLVSTGERLTRRTFEEARKNGGTVIIHSRTDEQTRAAIASPLTMIASDGFIENGRGHPRTSGTYAKVLGKYVRQDTVLTLMEALRKMSLEPARRLEQRAPIMAAKGRIKVGADADLTIFNPKTVIDKSTYENAMIPSVGIPFVIVEGKVVVDSGKVTAARPGRAIRAPRR